jgi:predicted dehydrogenase
MKVQIIGAGQLGSRHLQALRNTQQDLDITVVDPSLESLKVAKERYEALPEKGKHKIQFLEASPKTGAWDLLIVATNASHRRQVLQHAVENLQIKNYIIEKILFTKLADYQWADSLSNSAFKNAWVNCCMRQMPIYNEIKKDLKSKNFNYNVTGSNYGLVTNSIHYLDYASWLAGTNDYSLDFSQLDNKAVESKRKGYLELNGTLRANFKTGAVANVTCFTKGTLPIVVEVHSEEQRYVVLESERKALFWNSEKAWAREEREAVIPYQSQLTTEMVQIISENKPSPLPTLAESISIHLNLLNPLKEFLVKTNQTQVEEFPFT